MLQLSGERVKLHQNGGPKLTHFNLMARGRSPRPDCRVPPFVLDGRPCAVALLGCAAPAASWPGCTCERRGSAVISAGGRRCKPACFEAGCPDGSVARALKPTGGGAGRGLTRLSQQGSDES